MIRFILNNQLIETDSATGGTVLDYVRYHKRLTGTKIGCREGDCGACTLLVGSIENDKLVYRSVTSCLMPLGNAQGKHIVSVEGINMSAQEYGTKMLSPVQQALVDTNGTQCGFCTIGFVMSLTGFVLDENAKQYSEAIAAIDGNICRCTGYKSIERAAQIITDKMDTKPVENPLDWLVQNNFVPAYFLTIKERLLQLQNEEVQVSVTGAAIQLGGGTDLMVQKPHAVKKATTGHLLDEKKLKGIIIENDKCYVGASTTVTDFAASPLIQGCFSDLAVYMKLISSTPIRNMATLAGNFVNASPIGDMTIFFLALDAELVLTKNEVARVVKLKDFYKGYKQLDKDPDEIIEKIIFTPPTQKSIFNFEKVCKRTHLDIASVNTACQVRLNDDGTIAEMHLAAGGVAPFPKYLSNTVDFLKGKKADAAILQQAITIMQDEVSPISDARGMADYKRLLLRQLFMAHCMQFFGTEVVGEILGNYGIGNL